MPKTEHIQMSFNTGEISPRLSARIDFKKYLNALETLENFIPLIHGGVKRRPGSRHIAPIKDETKNARLLEFEFSTTQAYIIEMGPDWFRFYRNSGQIVAGDTDAVIANGTFDTDLASWTDADNGTGASIWNASGYMELDGAGAGNEAIRYQAVTVSSPQDIETHVLKFQVVSTDIATETVNLKIGNTIEGVEILASTAFKKGWHCIEFVPGASVGTIYITFEALVNNLTIDNVSLIDDAAAEIGNPYADADIFDIQYAQDADVMWITHWSYKPHKLTRTGHASWSLTEYTPTADPFTTATTFPRAVGFHEQRIHFAATKTNPQRWFASKSGDFEDMTTGTGDDDAFIFTLASGRVNVIIWLQPTDRGLILGTVGSEFTAEGETNQAITPTNVVVKKRSEHGSKEVIRPLKVGGTTLFVQRAGRKIREFVYQFETDNFTAPDLLLLAEHLAGPKDATTPGVGLTLKDIAFKQEPDQSVYAVRSDGVLLLCTLDRGQDVVAWSRHIIGGALTGSSNPEVEAVASIPHPDGDRTQTWLIVKRTINALTRKYVEFIGEGEGSHYNDVLVDSGLTGGPFGPPQTSLAGLDHLEGETVTILGDGAVYPTKVVTAGVISGLDPAVTNVEVGLTYTSTLKTLRPEIPGQTIHSLKKHRPKISVRINDTLGIKINNQQIPWRSSEDPMDSVEPLRSEDVEVRNLGWDKEAKVTITQALPMPTNILAVMGTLAIED